MSGDPLVSNFLIGPGRSGTSYIFNVLKSNGYPELPQVKECQFFDRNYERGIDWYHNLFLRNSGNAWDFSNRYYLSNIVAQRIYKYNPQANIYIIDRDRKVLFRSFIYFEARKGLDKEKISNSFERKWEETDLNKYIQEWEKYFVVVTIPFSDLVGDRPLFFHRFGDDVGDWNYDVDKNETMAPRSRLLGAAAKTAARFLRSTGQYPLLTQLKSSTLLKSLILKPDEIKWLDDEIEVFFNRIEKG